MKHLILVFFIISIFLSCSHYPGNVNETLHLAGRNKVELKKVLDKYSRSSKDSLKFKAACYLIENMKWHFGGQVTPSPMLWKLFLLEDSLAILMIQNPSYWNNSNTENAYLHARFMNPSRFYPLYLLAKLYDETGQQKKAVEMAYKILYKKVKIQSTAIKEIKKEVTDIINKNSSLIKLKEGNNNHKSQYPFQLQFW